MLVSYCLLAVLGSCAHASAVQRRGASAFTLEGDAPFTTSADILAAALTCPYGNPSAESPPVLLVHGTGSTGAETWGEGYVPALAANGYTACYVTLPGRAMGDMQISSEYVAYSLHNLASLSGGLAPAVISHSQGGPVTQWALQFWPSTRAITRAFIPLSPDFSGIDLLSSELSPICTAIQCQASLWQQAAGSNYYKALRSHDFQALVPTTSIWSKASSFARVSKRRPLTDIQSDGVVVPPGDNAKVPSARVVSVQQLCPLRVVNHVFMTIDAAAFAIALDALKHDGTASLTRLLPKALGTCLQALGKNMQLHVEVQLSALIDDLVNGILLGEPKVSVEPLVMYYAS